MPFGMKNAPSVFQREMQRVLGERVGRGLFVFIDDILIYTKTVDEHEEMVKWVLQRLCEEGYYVVRRIVYQGEISQTGESDRGVRRKKRSCHGHSRTVGGSRRDH